LVNSSLNSRTRQDTAKCIINKLFEERNPELVQGLQATEKLLSFNQEEETAVFDDNWMPTGLWRKPCNRDVLGTLINIFESKNVFLQEFRTFLAKRFLQVSNFDIEKEVSALKI
jgi:anaphase-promoting complex subunit 2